MNQGEKIKDRLTIIAEAEWSMLRIKNPENLLLRPVAMINDEELLILSAGIKSIGAFSFFPGEARRAW